MQLFQRTSAPAPAPRLNTTVFGAHSHSNTAVCSEGAGMHDTHRLGQEPAAALQPVVMTHTTSRKARAAHMIYVQLNSHALLYSTYESFGL